MPYFAFENTGYSGTYPANNHHSPSGTNPVLRHSWVQAKKDRVKKKDTLDQCMDSIEAVNI